FSSLATSLFLASGLHRLPMCFAEIGEYANEGYTVFCENIHAVIACWCFIMLDLLCIFVQFALFFLLPEKHSERHIAEWALLGWMSLSAALYITGPIGLGYEKTCMFRIYKWRVFLSMFRSLSSLGFYAWRTRIILCILWSYCFVTYAVGFHICRYTLHYIKDHYR
ncbi:hypothetical protein PFISCL1PPCAC_8322, partial [Pristionchus fissidentatus]